MFTAHTKAWVEVAVGVGVGEGHEIREWGKGTRAFPLTVGEGHEIREGGKGLGPSHLQWGRAIRLEGRG